MKLRRRVVKFLLDNSRKLKDADHTRVLLPKRWVERLEAWASSEEGEEGPEPEELVLGGGGEEEEMDEVSVDAFAGIRRLCRVRGGELARHTKGEPCPSGLVNLGNSCYLNAALQCLLRIPLFAQALYLPYSSSDAWSDSSSSRSFGAVLGELLAELDGCRGAVAPVWVKGLLEETQQFARGLQHDAAEALLALLGMYEEQDPPAKARLLQVFGGRLCSNVQCPDCGASSSTYDPVLSLAIDIPPPPPISVPLFLSAASSAPSKYLLVASSDSPLSVASKVADALNASLGQVWVGMAVAGHLLPLSPRPFSDLSLPNSALVATVVPSSFDPAQSTIVVVEHLGVINCALRELGIPFVAVIDKNKPFAEQVGCKVLHATQGWWRQPPTMGQFVLLWADPQKQQQSDSASPAKKPRNVRSLRCGATCTNVRVIWDGAWCWPRFIPPAASMHAPPVPPVELSDCFRLFLSGETLSENDMWTCRTCMSPKKARKTISLEQVPPVLIIQLKRFEFRQQSGFRSKVETLVHFPWNEPLELNSCRYSLVAVIKHSGTIGQGHYLACVKIDGVWWEFNDAVATRIVNVPQALLCKEAYILFYEKQEHHLSFL